MHAYYITPNGFYLFFFYVSIRVVLLIPRSRNTKTTEFLNRFMARAIYIGSHRNPLIGDARTRFRVIVYCYVRVQQFRPRKYLKHIREFV